MGEGLLSPMHLVIIAFVVLLLFGAKRLPGLGKGMGSGIREFKSGLAQLHSDADDETEQKTVSQTAVDTPVVVAPVVVEAETTNTVVDHT